MEMICEPCQNGDHNSHQISLGWICVGCACNWQSTLPAESPADLVPPDPAEQARLSYSAAMDTFNGTDDISMEGMLEVVMYASLSIAESLLAQQVETPLEQHIKEALKLVEDDGLRDRFRNASVSEIYAGAVPLEPFELVDPRSHQDLADGVTLEQAQQLLSDRPGLNNG